MNTCVLPRESLVPKIYFLRRLITAYFIICKKKKRKKMLGSRSSEATF